MSYNGTTEVASGLKQMGAGNYKLVNAQDIYYSDAKSAKEAIDEKLGSQEAAGQYIPKPAVSPDGQEGQLLKTNGDGTTEWTNQGTPTSAQVGAAVSAWLNNHPEATTTVQDGSITEEKLVSALAAKVDKIGENTQEVTDLKSALRNVEPDTFVTGRYAKNEYTEKDGSLYRANVTISAVENWNANKWNKTEMPTDMTMVLSDLENQLGIVKVTEWCADDGKYINTNVSAGAVIDVQNPATSSGSRYKYAIISCQEGDVFTLNVIGGSSVRAWAWADSEYKRITVSGPSVTLVNTPITAPANAAYLILNDLMGGAIPSYKGEITNAKIAALQSAVTTLKTKKINPADTSFFVVTANMMDASDPDVVIGGYYDKTNTYQSSSTINQSGFIPVVEGEKYTASYRTAYVVWYDSGKAFKSYTEASSFSNNGYVTAPTGAAFGRFMCTASAWSTFIVCKGDTPPASYVPYGCYIPQKYTGSGNYFGLSGVAFGTSLTYRAQSTGGYLQYLPSMLDMTFDNQGIGNATILVTEDYPALDILAAVKGYSEYSGKDICILEGFVNDFYRNPDKLGTYTDSTETTVCGCVRSAINYILTQNPDITLVLVLDHYGQTISASTVTNDNGDTQYEYYEEIAKVAESLGVPVIKGYAVSGMNEKTPDYFIDNIHPSADGAKQFAQTIFDGIKQIGPKVKTGN